MAADVEGRAEDAEGAAVAAAAATTATDRFSSKFSIACPLAVTRGELSTQAIAERCSVFITGNGSATSTRPPEDQNLSSVAP